MNTKTENNQPGIFSHISNTIVNIVVLTGLFVVILFVSNLILHKFFKFHLLTEHWYLFDRKAPTFIVNDMPIFKIK